MDINTASEIAKKIHDNCNCEYDGKTYYTHISMVETNIDIFGDVFIKYDDYVTTRIASSYHDLIEDARQTFNDIKRISNTNVARVVLKVTDVPAETRLMRHLLTMPKTVTDYRAIILKMADLLANATYSKMNGSSMYDKYKLEYHYRRPIFKMALKQYMFHLNEIVLEEFWAELDNIHEYIG